MSQINDPFKDQKVFQYATSDGKGVQIDPRAAFSFLQFVLASKKLEIGSSLHQFNLLESFFLIAGTGLGKTVAMPLYLWFRQMYFARYYPHALPGSVIKESDAPRVWVVEPKIAIVQDLHAEMNDEWQRWGKASKIPYLPPLFGCKTKTDHRNTHAPIMFITTGIFAIYARKGIFRASRDIVLMDEAHDTLESDASVELGVGLCRGAGVAIQYMSATVETSELPSRLGVTVVEIPGKRFPVWRHNTQQSLEECIVPLVGSVLVRQDLQSGFFPRSVGTIEEVILKAVTERDRAKGMLVIVNSFTGERSDARRIERLLKEASFANQIQIGLLASEVRRDPARKAAYEAMLKRWERDKARYVLIATSVVEMGVTLPDLDFVVTMDSAFGDRGVGGILEKIPLGTNALVQRLGRVGRVRPGIAYITQELGAPYTNLNDADLNAPNALASEPINFPMEKGSLTWVAYMSHLRQWKDEQLLGKLHGEILLPSQLHRNIPRVLELAEERQKLIRLGIADANGITAEGTLMERWIGQIDLGAAMSAHKAFRDGNASGVLKALCEGLLKEYPLSSVCSPEQYRQHSFFGDKPEAEIYRHFVEQVNRYLPRKSDRVRQQRLHQWFDTEVQSQLLQLEIKEKSYFRALTLLDGHFETFFEAIKGTEEDSKIRSDLLRYRRALGVLIDFLDE